MGFVELKTEEDFHAAVNATKSSGRTLVVEIGASWCKSCVLIAPQLDALAEQLVDLEFVKFDASELEDLAADLKVVGLPAVLIVQHGQVVNRNKGKDWESLRQLVTGYSSVVPASQTAPAPAPATASAPTPAAPAPAPAPAPAASATAGNKWGSLNVATYPGGIRVPINPAADRVDASSLARSLNKQIMELYAEFVASDGSGVRYADMATSDKFHDFVRTTAQLQYADLHGLSRSELMAFCLNLYNAMVIHGNIVVGPPDISIPGSLGAFFTGVAYEINGHRFTCDDVEHGILRGNKPHPSSGKRAFAEDDPRAALCIAEPDPRLHFSLVCGAKSCPPIRLFTPENLERGLSLAALHFCTSNVSVDVATRTVTLSRIFMWYGKDFADTDAGVLEYILSVLEGADDSDAKALGSALRSVLPDPTIQYAVYNWGTNVA